MTTRRGGRGGGSGFYDDRADDEFYDDEPPPRRGGGRRPPPPRRPPRSTLSDPARRVLWAIPAIIYAIVIVQQGGIWFAAGLIPLAIIGMHELYTMADRVKPVKLGGFIAAIGLLAAAHYGDQFQILLALMASVPLLFFLSLLRPMREHVSWSLAITMLGIVWIALPLAHAVLLRDLPHGGALVVDILIGTFIGDTCAYFGGRSFGRTPLAPLISPNKTVEGLLCGVVGGTFAFWLFAFAYQDWFAGPDALLIGFCVAVAAPIGDLFESLLKRDLDVKDTGGLFGPHGGVLDRLDAVFFTAVTAYYVSLAVL
jgi:phosphatidate cytidylyltransferase